MCAVSGPNRDAFTERGKPFGKTRGFSPSKPTPSMAAVLESHAEHSERQHLEVLEQMLEALCEHVARLIDEARTESRLGTREAAFQVEAFEERRSRALAYVAADSSEPAWIRIDKLEKLIEALECSRAFFSARVGPHIEPDNSERWSVLVR